MDDGAPGTGSGNGESAAKRVPFAVEIYDELNATVAYYFTTEDAHVDFEAFEIVGHGSDDGKNYTIPFYEGFGGCGADNKSTRDISKANKYIRGTVKWDGCSHIYFGDEGYIHLCGPRYFVNLGKLLNKIYLRCYEIGGFSYEPPLNPSQDNKV